ncbi:hypothetical protein TNCV_3507861 [Trichonephila clavipes]|uniref:Uncharacterized protein n=1 Tax=Trichonephila clavipes TaxID=2585209 RepID=A0A8X6RY88_TRICX|nr:hypothetical protein TNCV_3507861 [Trichonephila clavipes]
MDVHKCIVITCHVGSQNIPRAESPLEKLVIGKEGCENPKRFLGVSPSELEWNGAKTFCHLHDTRNCGQTDRNFLVL